MYALGVPECSFRIRDDSDTTRQQLIHVAALVKGWGAPQSRCQPQIFEPDKELAFFAEELVQCQVVVHVCVLYECKDSSDTGCLDEEWRGFMNRIQTYIRI